MEMAEYILSIFNRQLMIVFSWGFRNPVAIENGIRFFVKGFRHKGKVEVVYNEGLELFSVRILNADGSIKEKREGIYFDELVGCIDLLVEWCPDYEKKVCETYYL